MSGRGNGGPYIVETDTSFVPACNIHSYIFPNPFSALAKNTSAWTASIPNRHVRRAIPIDKPLFHSLAHNKSLTSSRLLTDTLRLASGLHDRYTHGSPPPTTDSFSTGSSTHAGPIALLHLPNSIVYPVLVLGALAAGWTVTGTNPSYTPLELAHVVGQCRPSVIFCLPGRRGEDVVRDACILALLDEVEIMLVHPGEEIYWEREREGAVELSNWISLLADREFEVSPLSVEEADRRVAFIIWSSGTTGKSKGAMLSHRALVASVIQMTISNPSHTPDERWIGFAPFYHIFGLYHFVFVAPTIGATVIVFPKFDFAQYLNIISSHRITHLHIVPPIAVALAKYPLITSKAPFASVRNATSGGAPLAPEVIREVWERLGFVVKMGYGMSELGGCTAQMGESWEELEPQLGSTGKLFPGFELLILDENGQPAPRGTPGELVLCSPGQMLGYLKNPKATAETLDEKGVHTGDIGFIDERGNIRIVDRIKEIIKYKAFQVSPTELESIIATLPEVHDVVVSSVYDSEQGTELPIAYVVPRALALLSAPGSSHHELRVLAEKIARAVENATAPYKRLRGGVKFISAVPKSPSGKSLRRLLKDIQGIHVDCYPSFFRSKL